MEATYINLPNTLTQILWILSDSDIADSILIYIEEYRIYIHCIYHLMLFEVRYVANLEQIEWDIRGCVREGRMLERERRENVEKKRKKRGD